MTERNAVRPHLRNNVASVCLCFYTVRQALRYIHTCSLLILLTALQSRYHHPHLSDVETKSEQVLKWSLSSRSCKNYQAAERGFRHECI